MGHRDPLPLRSPGARRQTASAMGAAALGTAVVLAALATPASALATPTVSVAPDTATPPVDLTVTANGFPPHTRVEVGAGPPRSEYEVLAETMTDGRGGLRHVVHLTAATEPGWLVFVVATEDLRVKASSQPVRIFPGYGVGQAMADAAAPAAVIRDRGSD